MRLLKTIIISILKYTIGIQRLKYWLNSPIERRLLDFQREGYLLDIGWIESMKSGKIVNQHGESIPWLTYPFCHFLEKQSLKELKIFEYGSGASTEYFAKRAKSVTSVEHDQSWFEKIKTNVPKSVNIHHFDKDSDDYINASQLGAEPFDLIIIDGRNRVKCCKSAIENLSNNGVIVIDNSDRPKYLEAIQLLHKKNFKQLDFEGISPASPYYSITSLFYRKDNVFNL
jgi:16S rRNA G966 N2-methylase RsmD